MEKEYDVIFGTGPLGLAVMDELLKRNKNIVLVNQSGEAPVSNDVPLIKCDALNKKSVINVCQNAKTVYHCLGLPYNEWKVKLPIMMENIIEGASKAGAKIVYADNLYAYGPNKQPLHENLKYNPIGDKIKVRAEVATELMEAHKVGKVIATIGRGSDFYGPRVRNAVLGERVFGNLMKAKKVELVGNPKTKHAYIFIEDFAKGLVNIGNESRANGEVWHLPHGEVKTNFELVNIIADKLGVEPKYRIANNLIVHVGAIFSPLMKDLKELTYQHTNDYIVDSTKYERVFGLIYTSDEEGIEKTISWYKDNG